MSPYILYILIAQKGKHLINNPEVSGRIGICPRQLTWLKLVKLTDRQDFPKPILKSTQNKQESKQANKQTNKQTNKHDDVI